jgi:hypothetical protein
MNINYESYNLYLFIFLQLSESEHKKISSPYRLPALIRLYACAPLDGLFLCALAEICYSAAGGQAYPTGKPSRKAHRI